MDSAQLGPQLSYDLYKSNWTFWDFRPLRWSHLMHSLNGLSARRELSEQEKPGLTEASVKLQGVTKAFGDLVAVREMDLEIAEGEFFTMLGPSGCGKTTTLRMVAGFEQPTAGSVLIDGADVAGLPAHKRPTNTVFQSYALFPHLSVGENVAFGLQRKKVSKDEIKGRVESELERVGLGGEINRRPNQLSGGQQQRVALARALVNLPKVLLLDEPLGALDLKLRKGLQVELKRIQREVGITFVYVTHDQEEALTMSDRIAVMNRGRVEQIARPGRGLRAPDHDLRRRVHRRLQPDARPGRAGERRPVAGPARLRGRDRGGDRRGRDRRALLRRRAAGEAPARSSRPVGTRRVAERRGHGRELGLPRHGDADRRQARR